MRKIRLCNAGFILLLSIVLLGCSDDYIANDYRKESLDLDNAPLIVLEAQDFVNNLDFPVQTLNLENLDTVSFNNKHSTRSVTANSLSINWLSYVTSEDNDYDIAIIPVQDESSTAFVQLTKYGRSKKNINKVIKKLIVRRSKKTGDLSVVLGTYICERNYYDNYNEELATLGYDFTDSDFSGYFIASRLDGSMLSGKYIQKGEEQFRFIKNPVSYSECSDSVSDTHIHLFLNLSSSAVSLSTRSVDSNSASVLSLDQQEESGSFYCSFCHKPADDCTCFVIVACKKCGKNVVNCTCDDNICQLCGGLIVAGHCDCCDICHKTPCECSDNNDNNSGNSGGSSGSSSGGGGGGGTSIGGGNSNNSSSSTSHITSIENLTKAASGSVEQMKNKYGLEMAVCNFGVQTMFKAIFGDSDLPPGMSGRANDMVTVWENHPEYWVPTELSKAQELANAGYFVVVGWKNPDTGRSGHVSVVVPGTEVYSSSWGCYVPVTMDTGYKKRESYMSLSRGYGSNKKNDVKFYYYKKP